MEFLSFDVGQVFLDPVSPEESSLLVVDGEEHVLEEVRVVDLTLLSLQGFSSSFNDFRDSSVSAGGFRKVLDELVGAFRRAQDFTLDFSLQVVVFIGFQVGEDQEHLESLVSAHLGETTVFDESVKDGGNILTMLSQSLEDSTREESALDFIDLLDDFVKEGVIFDTSSLVDVQQSFDGLETANVVVIQDSLGDFFVKNKNFILLDFSASR